MKRNGSALAALTLAVCLILGLGAVAAAADVSTVTAPAGSYLRVLIDLPGGETLREHEIIGGEMAPGLTLRAEGEGLAVVGTPSEEGAWTVRLSVRTDTGIREFAIEQFIRAPGATPVPTPSPTPEVTATPGPTPEPTPEPTLAPTPEGRPPITKNPTGETITEGGTAIFVSRADNAESIEWYLSDNAGGESTEVTQAAAAVPGLQVYGQGTETLTLSGIPLSMNGWQVECRFTGSTGAVSVSSRATISVREGALAAPVITLQPEGAELYAGESTTLMARATAPEGGALLYQWYSSDRYDLASVRSIDGARESSYTPPNTEGTTYYCVGIRSEKDGEESSTVYSALAEVTCFSSVRQHVHDFTGPWHWDGLLHWHECSCGLRQEEGYHSFTWTVTRRATAKEDGERRGVCDVCGYETTEVLPAGTGERAGLVRVLLVALLVLVALLLAMGVGFVILRSRGRRPPRPPRSGTYDGAHVRRREK